MWVNKIRRVKNTKKRRTKLIQGIMVGCPLTIGQNATHYEVLWLHGHLPYLHQGPEGQYRLHFKCYLTLCHRWHGLYQGL